LEIFLNNGVAHANCSFTFLFYLKMITTRNASSSEYVSQMVGSWKLISYELFTADSKEKTLILKPHGEIPFGRIIHRIWIHERHTDTT